MPLSTKKHVKEKGQVFTPCFIVRIILDEVGYVSGNILKKHIIDNSCGDGAFLCEIVRRYIKEAMSSGISKEEISEDLGRYIHGIEIDRPTFESCVCNLDTVVASYNLPNVTWDIDNSDALGAIRFDASMDYVVGNPPYVRVHNLNECYQSVKSFRFAQAGMTDLYLVFFELGFRMLNPTGKLCYITPSSWLTSVAAKNMREYISGAGTLTSLIDLGHFQAFNKITTYTIISCFDAAEKSRMLLYHGFDANLLKKTFVAQLSIDDIAINGNFYPAEKKDIEFLRGVITAPDKGLVSVKNGFATLADKVFITDVPFGTFTIPIVKASTSKWFRGFFPYDKNGKPLPKDVIFSNKEIAEYLFSHQADLLKGKTEAENPEWYLYGRTQALKDVYSDKISISNLIKDVESIKLNSVSAGCGVFSGLYILTSVHGHIIREYICSDEFVRYVSMLKNYKSGGYYTFNSRDLEKYLNYKISLNEGTADSLSSHE